MIYSLFECQLFPQLFSAGRRSPHVLGCYLDPVDLLYYKGYEIKKGVQSEPRIARHCFISRRFSPLRSIRLSRLAPLCLPCTVFFPRCSLRLAPRVHLHVHPIQMAKVNFAITKYLARKSLHAMEPPTILALPPPSTGEKLPLRERDPYSVCPGAQPAQKGTGRELILPT